MKDLKEVDDFITSGNISLYDELIQNVKGNIVEFPLKYMENYEMKSLNIFQNEYLVPGKVFT